jgi:hypothetical protein
MGAILSDKTAMPYCVVRSAAMHISHRPGNPVAERDSRC